MNIAKAWGERIWYPLPIVFDINNEASQQVI